MELLRLIASIRQGRLTAAEAIARLGSAAGDPVHAAADELGKLLRTVFLCDDYFTIPEFRREMHALLNRGGPSINCSAPCTTGVWASRVAAAPMNCAPSRRPTPC